MSAITIGPSAGTYETSVPDSVNTSLTDGSGSTAGTIPFSQLPQLLEESAASEKTVTKSDGSSVTTVTDASGAMDVVAETGATGTTLTQVGYTSPVQLQNFLGALSQALQSTGTGSPASTPGTGSAYQSPLEDSMKNLIQELATGGGTNPQITKLQQTFDSLMHSSGITSTTDSSGAAAPATGSAALQNFLASALPDIVSGKLSVSGMSVNTSA